jgi:hypothetical protein
MAFIPTDKQLECNHIVYVTTFNRAAHLGSSSAVDQEILKIYGGIDFNFCPMCGAQLREEA